MPLSCLEDSDKIRRECFVSATTQGREDIKDLCRSALAIECSINYHGQAHVPDRFPLSTLPPTDPQHPFHVEHMEMALAEARAAFEEDEVPVGAVIVSLKHGIIARAHNLREKRQDPTAHAEMIAITQAAAKLQSWRLENCILYVTLEPCPMCAGAIVLARLPMVVYGTTDPKAGACETLYHITNDPRLNHRTHVVGSVLAVRCAAILTEFFAAKRKLDKS